MLCRKLKKGFYHFVLANTSQAAMPAFFILFLLLLDSQWNRSWYPELILRIHEKSKREQTRCSQHYVIFLSVVIPSFHSIKLQIANMDCFILQQARLDGYCIKILFELGQIQTIWLLETFLTWKTSDQEENVVETCSQSKIQDEKYAARGGMWEYMIIFHLLGAHLITFSILIKQTAPSVPVPWASVTLEGSPHLFLPPYVFKITTVYSPWRKFPIT